MIENGEVRKCQDYVITEAIQIGKIEVVLGENMQDKDGRFYLVANYESNELFSRYVNARAGNNYLDAISIFANRIQAEIDRLQEEMKNYPTDVITSDKCESIIGKDFEGEIIVIKADCLSPEYRNEGCQIVRCTGGNGARARGLGSSVFCKGFFDGVECKYSRADVLGILKPEHYPEWLEDKLAIHNNPLTFEYGGYHFLPAGVINKTKTFEELSKKITIDTTMGIWSAPYNKMYGKSKVDYTYKGFYSACGNIFCDVFKCLENGKYYTPGCNELFLYTGNFKEYAAEPKQKAKKHKPAKKKSIGK